MISDQIIVNMAKVATKHASSHRHRHRKKSRGNAPAPVKETPEEAKARRWRTGVISLSVISFIAGVLIVVIPIFVAKNGVPGKVLD